MSPVYLLYDCLDLQGNMVNKSQCAKFNSTEQAMKKICHWNRDGRKFLYIPIRILDIVPCIVDLDFTGQK